MALVSIVLPVYNGEKYLRESMDSVLAQTWQEWELICVDDCSTDSTPEILREYTARDSRIRVIRNERNQKLPRSLNIGFAEAKGEFLTWTSDDNAYLPEALRIMHDTLLGHGDVPMVVADMEIMDEKGIPDGRVLRYNRQEMYWNNCVGACFMYRHSVVHQIGGYDTERFLVEDYDYWLRVQSLCGTIFRIPQILYRYRWHTQSLTITRAREIIRRRIDLLMCYFPEIMKEVTNGIDYIGALYFEGWKNGIAMAPYQKEFSKYIKEIAQLEIVANDKGMPKDKPIVLFGGGELGKKAQLTFGERVIAFLDNDKGKKDIKINGLPVFLPDDFIKDNSDINIVISVDFWHVYDIVCQLCSVGVKKVGIYCEKCRETC